MTSVLLIAAAAQLAFSIEAPKTRYLVGEPVVMTVTQHGRARIYFDAWFELGMSNGHMRVIVDRGRGFERFRRAFVAPRGLSEHGPESIGDGRRQEFVLSYDDNIGDVVFPAAGKVRIAFEYEDAALGRVRSNVVTLRIEAPDGEEHRAWGAVRALPERGLWLYVDLTDDMARPFTHDEATRRVLAAFPRSVYVQGTRVRDLAAGGATIAEAEALARDLAGGQFEPDALVVLAATLEAGGQDDRARRTWQRVIDRFPTRAAAAEAREALASEEDDDEAPR